MQNRYRPMVFLICFSILILYQNEYMIYTNHFLNAIDEIQNHAKPTINKAYSQSYGFFDGISNSNWELYRQRYQTQHRHMDNDIRNQRNHIHTAPDHKHAHLFYRDNYDAEFTCLNEMQLGVTHNHHHFGHQTPRWLCDPDRIQSASQERHRSGGNGCLMYLFDEGKDDPIQFFIDLFEELDQSCEVHVFSSHWNDDKLIQLEEISKANHDMLLLHPWGIEGKSDSHLGRKNYLTMGETLTELGHVGHTIDMLSLECDGCEWSVYKDILDSDAFITQLLLELHEAPYQVNDLFLEMKKHGYVIFHRETDSVDKGGGQNHAYSFIRLAPAFFESSKTSVLEKDTKLENIKPDKINVLAKDTKFEKTASTTHDIRNMSKHQRIPRHSIVLN
jgi:hypothetical protein